MNLKRNTYINTYMTERNQIKGRAIRGEAMLRTGQYAQAGSRPVGGEWIRRAL